MSLIVGIDPGITTGICALNLNGKPVIIKSSKKMGINKIIETIRQKGIPIVIATDVKNPPALIKKLTSTTKARLVSPDRDLKVGEKQKIVYETFPNLKLNSHETDACAAAIFAYRKFKTLFRKVDVHLKQLGKEEKREAVIRKIILGEAKSIKDALKEKQEEITKQEKKRVKKKSKEADLKLKIMKLTEEIIKLKEENKKLKEKARITKTKPPEEILESLKKKEHNINVLKELLLKEKKEKQKLTDKIRDYIEKLKIVKEGNILITRLKDLSKEEIEKLHEEDSDNILYVNKLTKPSKKTISKLKKLRIKAIVFDEGKKFDELSEFFTIKSENIAINKRNNTLYVSEDELTRIKKNAKILEEIIAEYKRKRGMRNA